MKNLLFSMTALTALLGTAQAAPQITAQSIIVNPVPASVAVNVWTDRDPSGNAVPNYFPGDSVRLYASVNQDAYVYLFNVDPQGKVDMILPNQFAGGSNFLKAGTTKVFPQPGANFTYTIAAPYGQNKVLALASKTPLNMDQIATFRTQQSGLASVNVQGQQRLAQALSIVVTPVPQNTWTTDTAYYNVAARPVAQPAPVRPAPVQPVPVRPAPVAVFPWMNSQDWRVQVQPGSNLSGVHEQYARQLRAQGYTLVSYRAEKKQVRSEWRKGQEQASLRVRLQGNRLEVSISRRNDDRAERDRPGVERRDH